MFDFIFGSKATINEKTLEQNKVKILKRADIKYDKNNCLAVTGSGKFYKGTYKNDPIVNISKEESILNEFIYWQEYKQDESFLKFFGATIHGTEVYLVFEFFAYTLEQALKMNIIKEDNKIKIAKQSLKIIETLQRGKKLTRDFRPGVLGITEKSKIKLLDFGKYINLMKLGCLVSEKLINSDVVERKRMKYAPPESLLCNIEDISHDIWSFGCLLIDLFSKERQVFKYNLTHEELVKLHNINLFPEIPDDISGVLRDIITKCLDKNYAERISISELSENLSILLDILANNSLPQNNNNENSAMIGNEALRETHKFVYDLDNTLTSINQLITDDLMDRTIMLKNSVEDGHENAVKKVSENYTTIKELMSDTSMLKIEILDRLRERVISNIQQMQQYYGIAMSEFVDAQNVLNDMKINVNSLSKLSHPEKYTSVLDSLTKNRELIEQHVSKYSDKEDYDKIMEMYDENKQIVDMFKTFINNRELLLLDILDTIKKHQDNFIKESNLRPLSKKLGIQADYLKEEESPIKNINEIYARVQDNSDLVIIYDIEKKKFYQVKCDRKFPAKCYSFYDLNSKSVYCSGGVDNIKEMKNKNCKNFKTDFTLLKIKINSDDFVFDFKQLKEMNHPKACHNMVSHHDYLIVVGGLNNKNCGIYDKSKNEWLDLPDTPGVFPNPAVAILNNVLFVFSGSASIDSFDSIHMLSLNNISRILKNEKGFENVLNWEKVDFYFDFTSQSRLRRGMAALTVNVNSILLFGGFDYDNIYDSVYDFNLKNKHKQESISDSEKEEEYVSIEDDSIKIYDTEFSLPIKTFFNSNLLLIDDYLVMIDGYNNAIEFNMKTREYFYYT